MSGPKVSIITISYQAEETLSRAIQSIVDQSYDSIEYIVIDGGSTDKTSSIIKKNEDHISFWVSEKDKGISDAFNKGLAQCHGEIVGILNADDWYDKDTVQNVVDSFSKEDADLVCGSIGMWKDGKKVYDIGPNLNKLCERMSIAHPATFVKKDVYQNVGGFNLNLKTAMDYDFILRCYKKDFRFKIDSKIFVNMSDGGVSARQRAKGQKEVLDLKNKHFGKSIYHYWYYYKIISVLRLISLLEILHLKPIIKLMKKVLFTFRKDETYYE
jgi:glycosyltransferase involved in cell wall biosynthesis